jgi:hypothetical protein
MNIPTWLTVDSLNRMLSEGIANPSRIRYLKLVAKCNRWYNGEMSIVPVDDLDDMTVDEGQAVARINKIKQTVDKQNSILLKNDPIVRRWPLLEGDAELADQMDAMFLQAWDETNGQQVLRSMLQEAQITGLSNCKVYWNPLNVYSNKVGQIAIEKLSPDSIIYDPQASNMHRAQDCRYIIHHTRPPLWWFLELYKEEGAEALGLRDAKGRKAKNFITQIGKNVKEYIARKKGEDVETVDVYEFWIWPHTMYASELISGDTIRPNEFPYGLVVTMVNDKILEDRLMPNPFVKNKRVEVTDEYGYASNETKEIGHKRHPFVPLFWMRKMDSNNQGLYGMYDCSGAVEQMITLQYNIDAIRRNIAINARSIANPTLIINPDAIEESVDTIHFANGQILQLKNNYIAEQAVQVLQGSQMPQQVFELLINDISEIEKAAGLEPGVIGLFPPGGTSHTPALTIGALQESAFGPLWTYVSEISDALLDMSVLYDGLIQQKYPPDRYMTVSRTGERYYIDWTDRHITANFKRRIVNGSTTPLFDVEKDQRMADVANIAMQSAISNNPLIIKIAIAQIEALNYPWAYQFIEILKDHLQKLEQMEQGTQMLGAMGLATGGQQQMQTQQAMPLPAGEEEPDYSGLEELGSELGIPPEQLMMALEG